MTSAYFLAETTINKQEKLHETSESKGQFFTKWIDSHIESILIANWNALLASQNDPLPQLPPLLQVKTALVHFSWRHILHSKCGFHVPA